MWNWLRLILIKIEVKKNFTKIVTKYLYKEKTREIWACGHNKFKVAHTFKWKCFYYKAMKWNPSIMSLHYVFLFHYASLLDAASDWLFRTNKFIVYQRGKSVQPTSIEPVIQLNSKENVGGSHIWILIISLIFALEFVHTLECSHST